jgi:hypothetical protein
VIGADQLLVERLGVEDGDDDVAADLGAISEDHADRPLALYQHLANRRTELEGHAVPFADPLQGLGDPDHPAAWIPGPLKLPVGKEGIDARKQLGRQPHGERLEGEALLRAVGEMPCQQCLIAGEEAGQVPHHPRTPTQDAQQIG